MAIQPFSYARKKKILVLISRGGGGHRSAGEALQEILGDSYDVEINYVFQDILKSVDTLHFLTQGKFTGEDLYNFLLKNNQKNLLRWMINHGKKVMRGAPIKIAFDRFFESLSELPDLIISPTPMFNYGAACSAQKYDIPFLILPTDLDGSTFLNGFPDMSTHVNFKLALPYDDQEIRSRTLENKKLRDDQICVTGFPVKPSCTRKYSPQEKEQIRKSFHLSSSHKTVTLIMGAVGGKLLLSHLKSILALSPHEHGLQLELNVCTGRNKKIAAKIDDYLISNGAQRSENGAYVMPSGMIIHIRGYLSNLAELMAVSDLVITKTGSCTVNEAIYLEKKVILDNTEQSTARYFAWEEFNIPFVEKYGLGLSFTDARQLPMLIASLLKYPEKSGTLLERPPFEENLRALVQSMLGE